MTLAELADWLHGKSRLTRVRAVLVGASPAESVWSTAQRLEVSVRVIDQGGRDAGRAVADEEADTGSDLLVVAGVDVSALVPAAVLVAALAGLEPIAVVGRQEDAAWSVTVSAVRDGLRRARAAGADPAALLTAVGSGELAVLAGLLEQAAVRRTPVVIDGLIAGAAALAAYQMSRAAAGWWLAGHDDGEPALRTVWTTLGLRPPLLAVGAPPGVGGLLAVPLLQAALDLG